MSEEMMPFNEVGTGREAAAAQQVDEAEWRAKNLPPKKLVFRWRYASKTIQLYERRLRSLAQFNVGPAVQAWVRSRLEWMQDNKLCEQPDGVLELTIDPEGDVAMRMLPVDEPPVLTESLLTYDDDGNLAGSVPGCGTVWVVEGGAAYAATSSLVHSADTFARDLLGAFGATYTEGVCSREAVAGGEVFAISDEYGVVPCTGKGGAVTDRLIASFDKLWAAE